MLRLPKLRPLHRLFRLRRKCIRQIIFLSVHEVSYFNPHTPVLVATSNITCAGAQSLTTYKNNGRFAKTKILGVFVQPSRPENDATRASVILYPLMNSTGGDNRIPLKIGFQIFFFFFFVRFPYHPHFGHFNVINLFYGVVVVERVDSLLGHTYETMNLTYL